MALPRISMESIKTLENINMNLVQVYFGLEMPYSSCHILNVTSNLSIKNKKAYEFLKAVDLEHTLGKCSIFSKQLDKNYTDWQCTYLIMNNAQELILNNFFEI